MVLFTRAISTSNRCNHDELSAGNAARVATAMDGRNLAAAADALAAPGLLAQATGCARSQANAGLRAQFARRTSRSDKTILARLEPPFRLHPNGAHRFLF